MTSYAISAGAILSVAPLYVDDDLVYTKGIPRYTHYPVSGKRPWRMDHSKSSSVIRYETGKSTGDTINNRFSTELT